MKTYHDLDIPFNVDTHMQVMRSFIGDVFLDKKLSECLKELIAYHDSLYNKEDYKDILEWWESVAFFKEDIKSSLSNPALIILFILLYMHNEYQEEFGQTVCKNGIEILIQSLQEQFPFSGNFISESEQARQITQLKDTIRNEFISREKNINTEHGQIEQRLRKTISETNSRNAKLEQQLDQAQEQLDQAQKKYDALQLKISRVSDIEWERIRQEDETAAAARKSERLEVNCSCSGETENCYRCSGSGRYTIDGYGHPV